MSALARAIVPLFRSSLQAVRGLAGHLRETAKNVRGPRILAQRGGRVSLPGAIGGKNPYTMRISRTTIDKLGIKLYDSPAAVTAELVANAHDADAKNVTVHTPLDQLLAEKRGKKTFDKGLEIVIEDDGHGMTPREANKYYLRVGYDRRKEGRKVSRDEGRRVMGRKGIGKLAPFGICRRIEVWSAGGKKGASRFRVSHFALEYDKIVKETDENYHPHPLEGNDQWSESHGTKITLKLFGYRRTPDFETFHRQLARRFGIQQPGFNITIHDTVTDARKDVGELDIETMPGTRIDLSGRPVRTETGEDLSVTGWAAFAKKAYPNPEVAGIRIYARGKFVANPRDFGISAGFTGEYTIRSYLVGAIHCDWLDEDDYEDLIQSGRQDILWTSDRGRALEVWGRELIKELGERSRATRQATVAQEFLEISDIEAEAKKRFPDEAMQRVAVDIARTLGGLAERDELREPGFVEDLRELALTIAPHKMLVDAFRRLAKLGSPGLAPLVEVFRDVHIAEATSLGQLALEKIRALRELETRKDTAEDEAELQELLERAPWLIDSQWSLLGANLTFDTLRKEFEKWYKGQYGTAIETTSLGGKKRPDFVLLHIGAGLEILEIKVPDHSLRDEELERIVNYVTALEEFLEKNPLLKKEFPLPVHVTLVCDSLSLGKVSRGAYDNLSRQAQLHKRTWNEFLTSAKRANQDYLDLFRKGKVTKG